MGWGACFLTRSRAYPKPCGGLQEAAAGQKRACLKFEDDNPFLLTRKPSVIPLLPHFFPTHLNPFGCRQSRPSLKAHRQRRNLRAVSREKGRSRSQPSVFVPRLLYSRQKDKETRQVIA